MCELLGLSSTTKTTINLSLATLAQRGENPHMHGDGWGVAFYDEKDVRLIKDAGPAKNSPWVSFITSQDIESHDIIAHIRKSTIGDTHYSNTHPFTRELYGVVHCFAHNGTLPNIFSDQRFSSRDYFPVGNTDSEYAFCHLMDLMQELWDRFEGAPPLETRLQTVQNFAEEMMQLGPANFLYCDGDAMFAHGDIRLDPLTNKVSWPGLYYLQRKSTLQQGEIDAEESGITIQSEPGIITLFASVPLNQENWIPLQRSEVVVVSKGQIQIARVNSLQQHSG